MKFAHATSQAVTRQGRMDQLRRDRSTAQALRAAFPSVHQLRIELKFDGPFTNTPTAQCHVLYPPARAFFGYPCPYSDCDGHFDLGEAVKAALADKSNVSAGMLECHGSRARDHASKQPCLLQIIYEVTATYHEKT
jgi:hypothetical protein